MLEFDPAGNLVGHWGGPGAGYQWPESNHGITVDHDGNVWIGGNGNTDTQILKFTRTGQFLLQVGKQGVHGGSNDLGNFWRAAKIFPDPAANELYVADGYGNRRVVVLDADSGRYKRHWGAYGEQARRRAGSRLRSEGAAVEAVQQRALRERVARRLRLRVRPRERPRSGVPEGRQRS